MYCVIARANRMFLAPVFSIIIGKKQNKRFGMTFRVAHYVAYYEAGFSGTP